jgi:hypothetical protein
MQPSPYTPGGIALEVPGRGEQLARIDERLAYLTDLRRLVPRIRVDHAPRGWGKSSLLRQAERLAQRRDALTVWVTANDEVPLTAAIALRIDEVTAHWGSAERGRLRRALEAATIKLSVGVPGVAQLEATRTPPSPAAAGDTRAFEEMIRQTAEAATRRGLRGVALFIDEIQDADRSGLRVLTQGWQHLQAEGPEVPAAVFAAGLPTSQIVLKRAATSSERFEYRPLGLLDDTAAAIAIVRPADGLGVRWTDAAVALAVTEAQGYPYTVQLIADQAWQTAGQPDPGGTITVAHVRRALQQISLDLSAMFSSRWQEATAAEREFLLAMARLGDGPVERSAVAAELGVDSNALGPVRAQLISKGLVQPTGRGLLSFTVPGFAAHLRGEEI